MTVQEYLRTGFEDGDREFVDGEVGERNIGELPHSTAQMEVMCAESPGARNTRRLQAGKVRESAQPRSTSQTFSVICESSATRRALNAET